LRDVSEEEDFCARKTVCVSRYFGSFRTTILTPQRLEEISFLSRFKGSLVEDASQEKCLGSGY
jgi:hypothetical protein